MYPASVCGRKIAGRLGRSGTWIPDQVNVLGAEKNSPPGSDPSVNYLVSVGMRFKINKMTHCDIKVDGVTLWHVTKTCMCHHRGDKCYN